MRVLVVGRTQEAMDKVLPLLRNDGFDAIGALTEAEAAEHVKTGAFDALTIGGAVEDEPRKRLHTMAERNGITAIDVEPGFKVLETYFVEVILPKLRAVRDG